MSTIKFDESDAPELKKWLVTRLEDISDADSDVLADYVLALVKSEEPDDQTRTNCIENLEDFLREHTEKFVDDVFATIRSKSFKQNHVPPKSAASTANLQAQTAPLNTASGQLPGISPTSPLDNPTAAFAPSTGNSFPGYDSGQNANGHFASRGDQSKKRSYNDREDSEGYSSNIGERAIKQMRRGGPNMRGGRAGHTGAAANGFSHPPQMPNPPGFPPLDPNNPMAAIMAMQAMGMPPVPGFPPFPGVGSGQTTAKSGQRCVDYDTKGFCAAGSECPYEHGDDHFVVAAKDIEDTSRQYDPNFPQRQSPRGNMRSTPRGTRGRGRGGMNSQRGGKRASFSSPTQNHDTRITSIVVEQIPEEKFTAEEVRNFFQEFGTIEHIDLQAYKRLAVIKYHDYESARKAYDSPKVVFDNRFVKVYWYKPDSAQNGHRNARGKQNPATESKAEDEEMIDPEEFAKKQAEAQRAHEEKTKKLKDAETAKEELDKRIKAQAEERRRLMEKLASKTGSANSPLAPAGSVPAPSGTPSSAAQSSTADGKTQSAKEKATEALRAKLAELEAEAETLGLAPEDPNAAPYPPPHYVSPYGRGRGGHRGGWRGYEQPSYRGGGRGGWRGGHPGGAVARLDNRPKNVSITALDEGVDFDNEAVGEALRQHLYSIGSFASIQPPSDDAQGAADATNDAPAGDGPHKTTIVTFHERYVAEMFIGSAKHTGGVIPDIGKVDMQWVPNASVPSAPLTSVQNVDAPDASALATGDVDAVSADVHADVSMRVGDAVDYDVADEADEDRWMVS